MNAIPHVDIKNYKIIEKIGQGAYGLVLLVKKKSTGKLYALKETLKEYCCNEKRQEFDQEMFSLFNIQNPAIISIHGFSITNFEGSNNPVMIIDYMPNGSLDNALEKNILTMPQKYIILLGISLGMKSLHRKQIVHRDLKPGNILLDINFYPKISDFGLSFISTEKLSEVLMDTPGLGTPLYQAPEVILGDNYDYKVDVFSFSFILYELITGKKPFTNIKSVFCLQNDICNGKRPNTSIIKSQRMKAFLELCWCNDRTKRPTFDLIFKELLDDTYKRYFDVSESTIEFYLSQFDDSLKMNEPKSKNFFDSDADDVDDIQLDSNVALDLAIKFDKGEDGFEIDQCIACEYYKKACDMGNSRAMLLYCQKLTNGIGIPADKKTAATIYKNFADIGDNKASFQYGLMLFKGDGIKKDKKEAVAYITKAANKGNKDAIDFSNKYIKNVEKKSDNNDQNELCDDDKSKDDKTLLYGKKLFKGDGVPENKEKASRIFKKLANNGNVKAMFKYGMMAFYGDGIKINKNKGIHYIKKSADEGYEKAMLKYGDILFNDDEIPQNKKESAKYYHMAAKKCPEAALKYAMMLINGDVIRRDENEAAKFMKMAADQGNAIALYNYGVMLFKGDVVKENKPLANTYIQNAIQKGNKEALTFYNKYMLTDKEEDDLDLTDTDLDLNDIDLYLTDIDLDLNDTDFAEYDSFENEEDILKTSENEDIKQNLKIFFIRLTSRFLLKIIQQNLIEETIQNNANLIIYDGIFDFEKYHKINPSIYINKIPGLCDLCLQKNFFKNLYAMKSKYPHIYKNFIPTTYQIPENKEEFLNKIQSDMSNNKWVLKLGNKLKTEIQLIVNQNNIKEITKESIVQTFISPYLIEGHKFDLRFYLLITDLDPLTTYMYNEGITYFCSEPFSTPTCNNKNAYIFQKKDINSSGFDQIRSAIPIIKQITDDTKAFMNIIKKISALSILSIFDEAKKFAEDASKINDIDFIGDDVLKKIPPLHRFFNLIAIDILIDNKGNPFIIGLNDNPGMNPLNEIDEKYKSNLIKSQFELIASILNKSTKKINKWNKIIPTNDSSINYILANMKKEISPTSSSDEIKTTKRRSIRSFKPKIKYDLTS